MDEYIVNEEDSLQSIAISHCMPLRNLLRLNGLAESSYIFPGMKLKLQPQEEQKEEDPCKFHVFYCTKNGEVKGTLTVSQLLVMFDPSVVNRSYCEVNTNSGTSKWPAINYHVCIDVQDIGRCSKLELPSNSLLTPLTRAVYIHFLLFRTGTETSEVKSESPKANVYFRLHEQAPSGTALTYEELYECAESLIKLTQTTMNVASALPSSTYVPFFDTNKTYKRQVTQELPVPELMCNSGILSSAQFAQLYSHLPIIFQLSA